MNVCVEDYLSDLLGTATVRPKKSSPKVAKSRSAKTLEVVDAVQQSRTVETAGGVGTVGVISTTEAIDAIGVVEAVITIELPDLAEAIEAVPATETMDAVEAVEAVAAVKAQETIEANETAEAAVIAEAIETMETVLAIEPVLPVAPLAQPETAIAHAAPLPPAAPAPVPVAPPLPSAPKPMNAMPLPAAAAPAQSPAVALLHRLANHEAYEQPEHRVVERATRWLRMRCDQQHYAVELLKIQEVVLPATLLPLRGAAAHVLGVMNLRGQIVPVIDLGLYLGRQAIIADASTRIVVIEEHGETLGLRVSAVEDVAKLTDAQIETPESTRACGISGSLFRGVSRIGGLTLILLDATSILK